MKLKQLVGGLTIVGALSAAMLEVLKGFERLLDDRVACLPPQLRDQRDSTRVVLVFRVVETGGPWWGDTSHDG